MKRHQKAQHSRGAPEAAPFKGMTLRQRAEQLAQEAAVQTPESLAALAPEEIRRILHELQVQQIELEMQNEELHQTQVELAATKERYFDLYDLAPVGYVTTDEEGRIVEANLAAATLLGVARSKLLKQALSRFIVVEDLAIYYEHRQQLFKFAVPSNCELRMRHKDGTLVWVLMAGTLACEPGGTLSCRVVMTDITERKLVERSLRIKNFVFDSSLAANGVADLDGILTEANAAFLRIWGFTNKDEVIGNRISHFLNNPGDAPAIMKTLKETGHWEGDLIARRRDGSTFVANGLATVVRDAQGIPLGYQAAILDVTERRRAADFLRIVVNSIPDFVFWKDRNSVFLGCNNAFAQAAGQESPDAIVGKTDYDLPWRETEADFYVAVDRRVIESNQAEYHRAATAGRWQGDLAGNLQGALAR